MYAGRFHKKHSTTVYTMERDKVICFSASAQAERYFAGFFVRLFFRLFNFILR